VQTTIEHWFQKWWWEENLKSPMVSLMSSPEQLGYLTKQYFQEKEHFGQSKIDSQTVVSWKKMLKTRYYSQMVEDPSLNQSTWKELVDEKEKERKEKVHSK